MEQDVTKTTVDFVFQLAVILVTAKLAGEFCERVLRQPAVLGELVAGMIIGPFALGGINWPRIGALFPTNVEQGASIASIPVSSELYVFAQLGAVVLLFCSGMETDFGQFFRYGLGSALVAAGGVILPFFFGAGAAVLFGFAPGLVSTPALFLGAIMTATSVGITARVLRDIRRLHTPEGVTVLAGAVIDDVIGILVLTIVTLIVYSGAVSASALGIAGAKAIGFWLGLTLLGVLISRPLSHLLSKVRTEGGAMGIALAVGLFAAVAAQWFGLAMIIGAYSMGLALSRTEMAHSLRPSLSALYHALVPVFFVVMGMLVDLRSMLPVLAFGAVITLLAIAGKFVGCGLPALLVGFNRWGALRIGIGMVPRGEVALIIAGIGLTSGAIDQRMFGVAVMMTVVTTLLAPMALGPAFLHGGRGSRHVAFSEPHPASLLIES